MRERNNLFNSIGYFNFARGICILFVIFGHTATLFVDNTIEAARFGNITENLGAGLMAMLFMVSGFGFRSKKNSKCIKQQAQLMLIPYVVTTLCVIGAKLVLAILERRSFWHYGGEFISTYLLVINRGFKGTIFGLPTDNIAWTWFLWALFGGWCIYNAIVRLDNEKLTPILVALCVIVGMSLTLISKVWFYCIPHMLQTTGFIYAGHMIQEKELMDKKLNPICWVAIWVFAMITLFFGGIDMFTCAWNLFILDYIGSVALGFLLLKAFSWLASKEPNNLVYDWISDVGYNTMLLLCIHTFDSRVIPWHRFQSLFAGKAALGILVCTIIRGIFVFAAFKIVKFIQKKFFKKKSKHKKIKLQID